MVPQSVLSLVIFLVSCVCFRLVVSRSYNNGLIFYDLRTLQAYLPPTVSVSRGRGLASVKFSEKGSIWSTFGKPCECRHNICGCCAGIKVKQYNFDQKMCANVTFVPPKEEALLEVFLNEKPSSKYGISVRNPSPFCIPVMMGIPMAMCVQMSDIAIKGNNLNMCMDFIVRLATTDLFEMHFQCMQMGLDGFQYIDKDGKPVIPPSNSKIDNDDDEYYDYETDENEISYGANYQVDKDNVVGQTPNTVDSTFIIGLQQQMEQLQNAQQIAGSEKDDLLTQINHDTTTLAPIVVESETEIIAPIMEAYGTAAAEDTETTENNNTTSSAEKQSEAVIETEIETEAETETETDTDTEYETETESENENKMPIPANINPLNDDTGYIVPGNNYNETPTTDASDSSTTTEAAIIKPIEAPINASQDIATSENLVHENMGGAALENSTANYASNIFNTTDSNREYETTTVAEADPTSGYISAPIMTTTATIEATTLENISFPHSVDSTLTTESVAQPSTVSIAENIVEEDENAVHTTTTTVVSPAADTSYRHLYSWSWH